MSDETLLEAASRLAAEAGRAPPLRLTPLAGGRNNRVYRVDLAAGEPLILKSYFSDPRDPRDRLGAEWAFITYAWERGVRSLPEPLAQDSQAHLGLYSHLAGRKLRADEVEDRHIEAALAFVLAVNAPPREPLRLPPGSEACFSLAEHISTVQRRVDRLGALAPDAPFREEAEQLVSARLVPTWCAVRAAVETATRADPSLAAPLAADDLVVSPSDFGFHNALLDDDGRLGFLDFEYAGRDDPAKLVCDFVCQPEIPVPAAAFDAMLDGLVAGLGLADRHRRRAALLLDLYRIKWACIILNPFLPLGDARRAFARDKGAPERAEAALNRAEAKLAEVARLS